MLNSLKIMTNIPSIPNIPPLKRRAKGGENVAAIVHIRLAIPTAHAVKSMAAAHGCKYTDLMRSFIEAGLAQAMGSQEAGRGQKGV